MISLMSLEEGSVTILLWYYKLKFIMLHYMQKWFISVENTAFYAVSHEVKEKVTS